MQGHAFVQKNMAVGAFLQLPILLSALLHLVLVLDSELEARPD